MLVLCLHSCIIARNQKFQCYRRCFDSNGLADTFSFGSLVINDTDRGKIVKKNGQKYFLTIHPAAAIYNRNLRSVLQNDLYKLFQEIKKMEHSKRGSTLDYVG